VEEQSVMGDWREALKAGNFGFQISDCGLNQSLPIRNSQEVHPPRRAIRNGVHRYATLMLLAAGAIALGGCREPEVSKSARSQQELLKRADRGAALIDNVASQLADLPAAVDTELRPPTVILDSTRSMNGQDVYAIAAANPQVEGNPVNIVGVPLGNGRFKGLNVRSGDIAKFYIVQDETVDEERQQSGFSRQLAKELIIAQVLDDNTFLIEGSLPRQVLEPAKLEIWRNVDDRLEAINEKLVRYAERRLPPLGWEPTPDDQVLLQIVSWLNQWLRQTEPKSDWKRDPMIDSLDPALLADEQIKKMLTAPALAVQDFVAEDSRHLQEAVWMRDISRWARGEDFDELARATALFDWTIRNIQLMPGEGAPPHSPWRTLADGRGTAEERAWVFALLCRQQALDVVMLELPAAKEAEGGGQSAEGQKASSGPSPSALRPQPFWLSALLLNNELYLFDTRLGLPIPGPGGEGVATLSQVQKDDAILRQLDLDDSKYPADSEAAKKAVAAIVVSPFELSRRARQLESKLTGEHHLVLTVAPSEFASQLNAIPGVAGVKLWAKPFRVIQEQLKLGRDAREFEALAFEPFAKRPLLWKARMRHFQGRREREVRSDEDAINDHQEAAALYQRVRPTDVKLSRISNEGERRVDTAAKTDATYWIALLSFDDGKYSVAADWLGRGNLGVPGSVWLSGTRYNLARALEAQQKFEEAAKLLEDDNDSPQRHGNRLRARLLRAKAEKRKGDTAKAEQ
jgi:hypothetical protein